MPAVVVAVKSKARVSLVSASVLDKVNLPMVLMPPGARMPPVFTATVPLIVPLPPSVPPLFTVTALPLANEPGLFTSKVPPLTVVVPVKVLVPLSTHLPVSCLTKEIAVALSTIAPEMVLAPVFTPPSVNVRAGALEAVALKGALVKVTVLAAVESSLRMVAPPEPVPTLPILICRFEV